MPIPYDESPNQEAFGGARHASRQQDATRILFVLDRAGGNPPSGSPIGSVSCILGQTRLQALDFWMRYPDYLANELISEFESGSIGPDALTWAEQILDSDEPDLRRFPMVRWRFGAYEPLDDALAILKAPGLLTIRQLLGRESVRRHDYFLLEAGRETANEILREAPPLSWYADRASLVALVAGDRGGKELKDRQYEQWEYGSTQLGSLITPISERVRARLRALRAA